MGFGEKVWGDKGKQMDGVVSFKMTIVADTELVIIVCLQALWTAPPPGRQHLSPLPGPPGSPSAVSTQEGSTWQQQRVDMLHNSPYQARTKATISHRVETVVKRVVEHSSCLHPRAWPPGGA